MELTDGHPALPNPVELLSGPEVDDLLARTQQDLARLERERQIAETAAIEAEQAVDGVPDDPPLHEWTSAQLDRFIEQLRTEHEVEMQGILDGARARARTLLDRAQTEADLVLSYARANVGARSAPAVSPHEPETAADELAWRADGPDTATIPPRVTAMPAAAPSAPPEVTALVTPEHAPFVPPPIADVVAVDDAPASRAEPVEDEHGMHGDADGSFAALAPAPPGGDDAPPAEPQFWKGPEEPKQKRRAIHRLPMFAIVQVIAVIIVLVVVLLRIG
jgi:hypothetical protein